jgi:hypothetical protein
MPPIDPAAPASGAAMPAMGAAPPVLEGDDATEPTAVLTVMDNHDGTFTLMKGDGESAEMEEGDEAAPAGETFDSIGKLLKGILDIVKMTQEDAEGTDQDNFDAGFKGDEETEAAPAKPALEQKY